MDRRRDHAHMNFMADALVILHAQDRTRSLRERALDGDTQAAALLREHFHLLYWEYEGRQIVPRETAGNGGAEARAGGRRPVAPPPPGLPRRRAGARR